MGVSNRPEITTKLIRFIRETSLKDPDIEKVSL